MDQDRHVHSFGARLSPAQGHYHYVSGTTGRPRPLSPDGGHFHLISGRMTIDERHAHPYLGQTGPAVRVSSGRHIHDFQGFTQVAFGHRHSFSDRTGAAATPVPAAPAPKEAPSQPKGGFLSKLFNGVVEFLSGGSPPPGGPEGPAGPEGPV